MHLRSLAFAVALAAAFAPNATAQQKKQPNIVIVYADDMGYGDLGCYGHPTIKTPELDRMAAEGMRLTQFYSGHPYCTPSRAALLTGRLPIRSGLNVVLFPKSQGGIPDSEITIAKALRAKGYATACIGKWHLGHLEPYRPLKHGFDRYYGILYSNDMKPADLYRDDKEIEAPAKQETLTQRYTDEAIQFVKESKAAKKPFFLYLPHSMPHVPLAVSPAFAGKSRGGTYGDVIEELDANVGRLLKTLRDENMAENTLVIFSSDNGPWLIRGLDGGSPGPLRDGKNTTWEGGMRVPGIAWWPGQIKPGSVNRDIASVLDLFPTCMALAGAEMPADRPYDGKDLSAVLRGTGKAPTDTLYYYRNTDVMAVRKGPWKLHVKTATLTPKLELKVQDPPLLFHLQHDIGERHDLAKKHPEVVADLLKLIEKHKAEVKPGKPQT